MSCSLLVLCNVLPEMDTIQLYTCRSLSLSLSRSYLISKSYSPTILPLLKLSLSCRIVTRAKLTAVPISSIWWIFSIYQARTEGHCLVQTWRSWSAGAALAFLQPQYQDICLSRDSIAGIIKKSILVDLTSRSHMILTWSTARGWRDISTLSTF